MSWPSAARSRNRCTYHCECCGSAATSSSHLLGTRPSGVWAFIDFLLGSDSAVDTVTTRYGLPRTPVGRGIRQSAAGRRIHDTVSAGAGQVLHSTVRLV